MSMGRRNFLQNAILASAAIGIGSNAALAQNFQNFPVTSAPPSSLLRKARVALEQHSVHISNKQILAIADFSSHSRLPRFHLIDVMTGRSNALLVSHGKGSDLQHSGFLENFSNIPGSEATSAGAYLVGESYVGQHGSSRRLIGLEPENDQAEPRAIVIHGANYVGQNMIDQYGKIGRSQGCFAFSQTDIYEVLNRLAPGAMLYAGKA